MQDDSKINKEIFFSPPRKLYSNVRFSKMSTAVTTDDLISTWNLKRNFTLSQMLLLLILLLQWRVTTCTSSPTLEDNMLPTDEEVISDLINSYRGQPEQEIALNLPTDEEAFNEIKPILQSGSPLYYTNSGGHFISSSFPGISSLFFHF